MINLKRQKTNKFRTKVIAVLIITIVFCSSITVSAATNAWDLITSQVNISFYYSGGGFQIDTSWSVSRQNAWIAGHKLGSTFNQYVIDTDNNNNVIYQLEYLYDHDNSSEAVDLGTEWNSLYNQVGNTLTDVQQLCSGGVTPPTVNGAKVTTTEYQNLYAQIQSDLSDVTALAKKIHEQYTAATYDATETAKEFTASIWDIATYSWNALGPIISTIGTGQADTNNIFGLSWTSGNMMDIVNKVIVIVKTFAYALAVILFGINVTSTSLQYELLTLRGGIKIFVRVLLVKIWIDLAVTICFYTLNIMNSLAVQIMSAFGSSSGGLDHSISSIIFPASNTDNSLFNFIGAIINVFSAILWVLPMFVLTILIIVAVCSVMVKIIARAFELTCLITVSPLFFATLVGDETRHYFRRFISAFLSTAGYIVFIGIVYSVASIWLSECSDPGSNFVEWLMSFISILPRALIIFACCQVMRKPPKVLTSLFDGG